MTAHAAQLPLPSSRRVDALDDPFWEGCQRGVFLLHQCLECDRYYWPASSCVDHGSSRMAWTEVSGLGTIHTFVWVHRTRDAAFRAHVPYLGIVVLLDEKPYFHSSLLNPSSSGLHIGARVSVILDSLTGSESLPRFRLIDGPGTPASDAGDRDTYRRQ